jgi:hypothetical protein
MVIRRTLPAMASTLVGFVIVRVLVSEDLRAHLLAPLTLAGPDYTGPLGVPGTGVAPPLPGAWLLSHITKAKCTIGTGAAAHTCPGTPFRVLYTYQPASRFWSLQIYEMAVFLALALILVSFCFWWVRRNAPGKSTRRTARADKANEHGPSGSEGDTMKDGANEPQRVGTRVLRVIRHCAAVAAVGLIVPGCGGSSPKPRGR